MVEFFNELQTNSLIKFFSNQKYRSLLTIPEVNLQKGKQNSWTVEVWIADELFYFLIRNLIYSLSFVSPLVDFTNRLYGM